MKIKHLPAGGIFWRLLIIFANSLDPDQDVKSSKMLILKKISGRLKHKLTQISKE